MDLSHAEDKNFPHAVAVMLPGRFGSVFHYSSATPLPAGQMVRVPFGRRDMVGLVWFPSDPPAEMALKPIHAALPWPAWPEHMLKFMEWMARYTMNPLGLVLKHALGDTYLLGEGKITAWRWGGDADSLAALGDKAALLTPYFSGSLAGLAKAIGVSPHKIQQWRKKQWLLPHQPMLPAPISQYQPSLNPDQAAAASALQDAVAAQQFQPFLLDGVTGAGKTEVYFAAIDAALAAGKQILVLLPEIALTQQLVARFTDRFGTPPLVWHSGISSQQRRQIWHQLLAQEAPIIVGARSALFLPFARLGLIILDEEHDASYKQEEGMIYHARDMAVVRAKMAECPICLVSATPSLESVNNADQGRYHRLYLPSRHAGAQMPQVKIIDMRQQQPPRGCFLSPPLRAALADNLAAGQQSLLFLNRRGYAPLSLCRACGYRFQCPDCAAWLVMHQRKPRLSCHHCGFSLLPPSQCPQCAESDTLHACGPGVERIAEEVRHYLPDARVQIMASDELHGVAEISAAIDAIGNRQVDIVVGTQMIAKGHHFPAMTLVGVVDADIGLAGGDMRASERTYQLLHQVAGRAGRADQPGRVLVQSHSPDHRVIQALAANERDAFFAAEADERLHAHLPPFGRLAAIIISSPDEAALEDACRQLARLSPRADGIRVLGPAPAPIALLRGRHRRRFLIKAALNSKLQDYIASWLAMVKIPAKTRVSVDIDPQSFF